MRVGNSFKRKDITGESMKLKGKMAVDPELRAALTDADEGILRPGALPKMNTSSTSGNKQLLDALEKAGQLLIYGGGAFQSELHKKKKTLNFHQSPKTKVGNASKSFPDSLMFGR